MSRGDEKVEATKCAEVWVRKMLSLRYSGASADLTFSVR